MAVPPVSVNLETLKSQMSGHAAPRVKLPDVKKPVTPGPNSWAQSKEHDKVSAKDTQQLQPTNRDRYENKVLPEISPETSNDSTLQPRRHIQPAIPLINTLPLNQKNRAVTDPGEVRSLLGSRKPSYSQLKKKGKIFEFSSSKLDLSGGSELPRSNVPPKALALLGVRQEVTPTLSPAASQDQTPIELRHSPQSVAGSPPRPARQVKSDPASTRLPSNDRKAESSYTDIGTPVGQQNPSGRWQRDELSTNLAESQRIQKENGSGTLRPPVVAAYGNVGKQFGVIQQQVLRPSESFRGIIETASPSHTEDRNTSDFEQHITPTKSVQREPSGEMLRPTVYSPNAYNCVWGYDPAVVSAHLLEVL